MMFIIFCLHLLGLTAGDSSDVTVIYRLHNIKNGTLNYEKENVTDISIHSRTNALGLPFSLPNGKIIDPSVGADVAPCGADDCPWTISDWELKSYDEEVPQPPLSIVSTWEEETTSTNISSYLKFNGKESVTFTPFQNYGTATVYLLDGSADIRTSDMYGLRIETNQVYVLKCTQATCCSTYRVDGYTSRRCSMVSSTSFRDGRWILNTTYVLGVNVTAGQINFSVTRQGQTLANLQWRDGTPIAVNYTAFGTLDMPGRFSINAKDRIYELDGDSGSMISSMFVPSSPKLCISITSFTSPDTEVSVSAETHDRAENTHFAVGSVASQSAWITSRFIAKIPTEFQQNNLSVTVKASKKNTGLVLIQRISGCNGEAPEDIAVLNNYKPLQIDSDYGFDVAVQKAVSEGKKSKENTTDCYHGGVYDEKEDSCSCPVGFTGKQCEEGCGPNRYGNDCGGVCSTTIYQCENIIMCRPNLKCDCAPGFTGPKCLEACESGYYGVGCKQTCGHCYEGHCDKYTGLCHTGCAHGYTAPFCKQELRSLISPPSVANLSFYETTFNIDLSEDNMQGGGEVLFYQLQFKKTGQRDWLEQQPRPLPENTIQPVFQEIRHLRPGVSYDVRVVLLCSGVDPKEDNLPVTTFVTDCIQPAVVDYNITLSSIYRQEFQLQWDYLVEADTICPVIKYEVYMYINWQWKFYEETEDNFATVSKVLPGSSHKIKVQAITEKGPVTFSPAFIATLPDGVPDFVINLRAERPMVIIDDCHIPQNATNYGEGINVTWQPPMETEGVIKEYIISYKCTGYVGCRDLTCLHTGEMNVKETSALLLDVKHHAYYSISVAAVSGTKGDVTTVFVTTPSAKPDIGPAPSPDAVSNVTNSSFIASWQEPADCSRLNSFLYGYQYQLVLTDNDTTVAQGSTEDTHVLFTDLQAHTDYQVRVQLLTSTGYDPNHALVFNASTKSTVPGPVQHLAVYKRSRRLLGVRWSAPLYVSGTLESFRLSYRTSDNSSQESSLVLPAAPCHAWPEAFCHTVDELAPKTRYSVTVQARNAEVKEDGEPSTVVATTVEEGAPGAPEDLRLTNRTDTTLAIQWKLPQFFNGIIRSYVLNIEQTDAANSSECCQNFPLQEVPVPSEEPFYTYLFSNLSSASRYTISVSWKTVALGLSSTISANTRPKAFDYLDEKIFYDGENGLVLENLNTDDNLCRGYLVLIQPENSKANISMTPITNPNLDKELSRNVLSKFYVAAEILPEEVEGVVHVDLTTETRDMNTGVFSRVEYPALGTGVYKAFLVKIREYASVYSVSLQETSFTVT